MASGAGVCVQFEVVEVNTRALPFLFEFEIKRGGKWDSIQGATFKIQNRFTYRNFYSEHCRKDVDL